ncbi:truncated FRIGIDA-like protein 1 isoform X2 [Neltuma alba]|uniref:truncated FRIGIDA-like protein 1 isoform X2 n=1 Tax=Neltuma alba TaxID=207710 RepID=UPI0010A36D33|nr:truncated FRIGIDA-like protein 1 isoform X2 [Prosopis alba]XP_028778970.1 truncated FRIGIDA-like protein 1 isoform X2 [Prosopis alba]
MATTLKTISAALKLIDTKKDNLRKAYDDLHAHSQLLSSFSLSWSEIDSHFTSIQNSLTQRFHLLESLECQGSQPSSSTSPIPMPAQNPNDPTQTTKDPLPSSSRPSSQNQKLPVDPSASPNPPNQNGANVVPKNFIESSSVMPRYELSTLCEKMDGKGLRQYVIVHAKEKTAIQAELPGALRCAPDPAAMVLDSLDGFYGVTDPRDMEQRKFRRACIVLMEQLRVLSPNIGFKVRERAKMVASEWKASLWTDGAKTLEALGFLHFVVAYGLLSEVSMDELVDFTAMAANNDEVPQLCRTIGLTEKIPDLVQKLVDKGKHVLAVKYIFEFSLAEKIPPVPILKACVDEANKLAKRLLQEGKSLNEATARETHALKSVIKVIESHNLESQYPPAILEQQIVQLNMQKADRKRAPPPSVKPPPESKPQQQQKTKKQKQQQQIGKKHPHPQTSAQLGPMAVQKIVSVANSALHQYQQPLVQPTGPSVGPYGFAGVPMGSSGNPTPGGSHLYSEPNLQSAYYDRTTTYSGYGLQQYYQSLYPQ